MLMLDEVRVLLIGGIFSLSLAEAHKTNGGMGTIMVKKVRESLKSESRACNLTICSKLQA